MQKQTLTRSQLSRSLAGMPVDDEYSVTFVKKNGETRTISAIGREKVTLSTPEMADNKYISVFDTDVANYRTINTQTATEFVHNDVCYEIVED